MPAPYFSISADGVDVTKNFMGANMTMTITDGAGLSADVLQVVLDDLGGMTAAPRTGAVLNPVAGYVGRARDFGLFSVNSVAYSGWPQKITIDAKSVAAKSMAKQRDPKAYPKKEFPTYGDIFLDIAKRIGYPLQISAEIKSKPNEYEAQADENALEFTTRIGEKLDATVTVKGGYLVVVKRGSGQGAGGAALDRVKVAPGLNLLSYTVTERDAWKHSDVEATYYDRAKNKREIVTVRTGMEGPKFLMRSPYQSEAEAKEAAEAHAKDLLRMQADATFEIDGDPFAQAETWAAVSGVRTRVDGGWWIKTATHNFSASAPYTVSLQCGTKPEARSESGSKPSSGVNELGADDLGEDEL